MALKPSNVVEWLQAERLTGNIWANYLLDLLDGEAAAEECANAINDLNNAVPDEISKSPDLWRLVEWITERLHELDEIKTIADDFGPNVAWPNGSKPTDTADKLRAMFESGHWQMYDL